MHYPVSGPKNGKKVILIFSEHAQAMICFAYKAHKPFCGLLLFFSHLMNESLSVFHKENFPPKYHIKQKNIFNFLLIVV